MNIFRPWGSVRWLLDHFSCHHWSLLACCGSEIRSITLAAHLGRDYFQNAEIATIRDPQPLDPEALEERLQHHQELLQIHGYKASEIQRVKLIETLDAMCDPITRLADKGSTCVIIDITSLPKLWFFPIIRAALKDTRFENVMVTYTSAASYSDELSENLQQARMLPGFCADDEHTEYDSIIVGIGFEPMGVIDLLNDLKSDKIQLIFPFPPSPPGQRRNWGFVKEIEGLRQRERASPPGRFHVDMYNCPQIFDALCDMTSGGRQTAAIAPYGPKTVSLAMCLFALAVAKAKRPYVPVYYSQPLRYALDYTNEPKMQGDTPDIKGYYLRLNGRDFYTLPEE